MRRKQAIPRPSDASKLQIEPNGILNRTSFASWFSVSQTLAPRDKNEANSAGARGGCRLRKRSAFEQDGNRCRRRPNEPNFGVERAAELQFQPNGILNGTIDASGISVSPTPCPFGSNEANPLGLWAGVISRSKTRFEEDQDRHRRRRNEPNFGLEGAAELQIETNGKTDLTSFPARRKDRRSESWKCARAALRTASRQDESRGRRRHEKKQAGGAECSG